MNSASASRPASKLSSERRVEMYRREIGERAGMLYRLGYTAAATKSRLKASVAWDFEMNGTPKHAAEIDRLVDSVYKRGGGTFGSLT